MANCPRSPRSRTLWRVLCDPERNSDDGFLDQWFVAASPAYLVARQLEREGREGVEVNRCVLRENVSRVDLLNRTNFLDESEVDETWRVPPRTESA